MRALAPVVSQGVTAGTSLLLQVVAARQLGLAEYGVFAVFLALLVSATALHAGYVGDSLAVLDRFDLRIRAAVVSSALLSFGLCGTAGVVFALVLRDLGTGLLFAGMLVLWLAEETLRRLLMARMEFWKLVWNDVSYLLGTLVALGAWYLRAREVTMPMLFAAMGVGACTAVVAGLAQLPRSELRALRPGWAGMGEVASFAGWRAAQAALRPTALLLARVLVAQLISLAAVGLLEAARLVVAPLQVIINGAGSFLLAGYAAGKVQGTWRVSLKLTAVTLGGGVVLTLAAEPLGRLMTGAPVDGWLVLGWVVYLATWAAGLPFVTAVVAQKRSRAVFLVRVVDSVAGLALAALALILDFPLALVPWLMALGQLYSCLRLYSLAVTPHTPEIVKRSTML
ncbi:hypothetical protein SAMN05421504_101294 [Amycolatopsis xylanica]|uniref:Membrane protein involved in the export of O-antigen and teichoic acid n=1 Tax=Amycolatopsis xylanica TaxID=589385 RepID=A0A1H2SQV2_9PSEU|nr:hypothetical protein [Amycolatopsis xylanica]SDW33429.1 hypothetical protein SAMN05421504_101294 [Amycolatopsis xylanica]